MGLSANYQIDLNISYVFFRSDNYQIWNACMVRVPLTTETKLHVHTTERRLWRLQPLTGEPGSVTTEAPLYNLINTFWNDMTFHTDGTIMIWKKRSILTKLT